MDTPMKLDPRTTSAIAKAAAAACATAKPTDDRVPAPPAPPSADPAMASQPVQTAANDDDGDPGAMGLPCAGHRAPARAGLRQVIGRRLRAARVLQGLDQSRAAEQLGYETSSQLSQWEQAKRTPPLEQLVAAAETYGTTTDFLLGLSNEPDRDAHMALRAATLRGVRAMLIAASESTVQLFERRAALIGPDASHLSAIVDAGQALQNAIAVLMRADGFQELRGGASVVRCADDLDAAIVAARRRLDAHREMGDGIQAQLRAEMVDR